MFFRLVFYIFIVNLMMPQAWAQVPLSLDQAIQEALGENRSLKAKQSQVQAAKARIGVERSLEDPMLGIEFEEVPTNTWDVTQGMMANYSVIQKFPFPSKLITKGKKAKKEYLSRKSEYDAAKLEIRRHTEHAYHELYFLERAIKINRELQTLFVKLTASEKGRYDTGKGSAQNFLKAQTELEKMRSEAALLEAKRTISQARLNILRHRDPSEKIRLAELPKMGHTMIPYAELEKQVLESHPEVQAAQKMWEANKSNVSFETQQNLLPDFQARFSYNQRFRQNDAWTVEGMITIPFVWGKNRKSLKEALALREKSKQEWLSMKDESGAALKETYALFESAKQMDAILRGRALPQAALALRSAEAAYESGQGDFLMLIDSAREFKKMKLDALMAFVETHRAYSDLYYATGGVL